MTMADQYEREEQALHDDFERGAITQAELNKALRELSRNQSDDILAEAEEAADRAYRDVVGY